MAYQHSATITAADPAQRQTDSSWYNANTRRSFCFCNQQFPPADFGRLSRNDTFAAYTVDAHFESRDQLRDTEYDFRP